MLMRVANAAALLIMPFVLSGVLNRVKSLWSGRRGAPILQLLYDTIRLLRKSPVYSRTTSPIFRVAPIVSLVTAVAAAAIVPLLGTTPVASFDFDYVWLAHVWGLGRMAVMLAALDTGSAFEGMGAAREATFATLLEPTLLLVAGALCLLTGEHTLHGAVSLQIQGGVGDGATAVAGVAASVALFIILQVETGRIPVDDPATHLELTMIHEVMVLDHSGPDLAAIQAASAVKLFTGTALIATLLAPRVAEPGLVAVALHLGLCVVVTVVLGTVESLVARLKLSAVPQYILVAAAGGSVALLASAWRAGVGG